MKLATIDVGTNTTLLLVADASDPIRVLAERAEITRLGRGIGGGAPLGREGIERTLQALAEYAAIARGHAAPIAAVGTEALRRAPNADDFLGPAAAILGVPVEVIDGEREAALTFLATRRSFPTAAAGRLLVVDVGGGSTEIVASEHGIVSWHQSLALGSVRLSERHLRHDPPADGELAALLADVRRQLDRLPPLRASAERHALVATAGTATSLAAMALALRSYHPHLVHGHQLAVSDLEAQVERLRRSTQPERESMAGLDPRRADLILAGACILLETARRASVAQVTVSDRGVRWGLLCERLDKHG